MTDLATIGQALWGADWMAEMERQTGVGVRTIRRMVNGSKGLPAGLQAELATLLRAEARRLDAMAGELEAAKE